MATILEQSKDRLRKYLNPSIQGENTEAILEALAHGPSHLITNVEAVYDMLYVVSAKGTYLDERMSDRDITRPENVGLSDDVFREIGIEISNRKQIRDLVQQLLRISYGEEFTRATSSANEIEPYNLQDGDVLLLEFDDQEEIEVVFLTDQFQSINFATAQEVADVITKTIRRVGRTGSAVPKDEGLGNFVQLISETDGPSSSVSVTGGRAQNELRFDTIRPTSAQATTQWTLSVTAGGSIRATWTGGPTPSLGKVKKGDYVNIYGTAFNVGNRGTFTIDSAQGGVVGTAYVEFENPDGVTEVVVQGNEEAILFFDPSRSTILSKTTYAASFQTESKILEIFMPATTRIIRRERQGASHLHDTGPSGDVTGPYIWDTSTPYLIGGEETATSGTVDASTGFIIEVDDASVMPDEEGYLIFGYATENEEGPIPYIARPSSNTLMIDPSYSFENSHAAGTNVSLVAQNYAYNTTQDGSDFPTYITDVVSGRIYTQELIESIAATGITLIFTILYPGDEGLAKWGTDTSDKFYVWGE